VAPLSLVQKFVRKWIDDGRPGKGVFTSPTGGLFTPAGPARRCWPSTRWRPSPRPSKGRLRPFNNKVQTVNPDAYPTGFNETMTETAFRWLDDSPDFYERAGAQAGIDARIGLSDGRLDPPEMIDAMIEAASNDSATLRNVVSKAVEEMLKESQAAAWAHTA
jgi:hypothetical protein